MTSRLIRALTLSLGPVSAATAVDAQLPAGQVLERAAPAPRDERVPLPEVASPATARAPIAGVPGFELQGVAVEGATLFGSDALAPLFQPRLGQPVDAEALLDLARSVQTFYRQEGYVFTRVVVAPPDPESGIARIRVFEAVIESVTVEESAEPVGPAIDLARSIAAPLEGLANPSLADLERVLLLINDIPGFTRATAIPQPGGGPGALALTINVERDPMQGVVFGDTRQSPVAGRGLLGAQALFGSWSSSGDSTALTSAVSVWDDIDDLDERQIVELRHSRWLTPDGLVGSARALWSRSRPGGLLERFELQGEELEFELSMSWPIIRTRPLSLWVRGGLQVSESDLDSDAFDGVGYDESARTLWAELEGLRRDARGYTAATVGLSQGLDLFGASESGDMLLSRDDAEVGATVIYAAVEREHELGDGFSLFAAAGGQLSSDPLLATREYVLGGTGFARGYDPAELLGDHGLGLSVELRRLTDVAFEPVETQAELYLFNDFGRVWNLEDGAPASENLHSYGAGVRFLFETETALAAEVAKPTSPLLRNGEEDPRLFVYFQQRF